MLNCSIGQDRFCLPQDASLSLLSVRRPSGVNGGQSNLEWTKKEEEDTFDGEGLPEPRVSERNAVHALSRVRRAARNFPFHPARSLVAPSIMSAALVAKFSVSMMSNKMPLGWSARRCFKPLFPVQCHAEKTVNLQKCSQYHP